MREASAAFAAAVTKSHTLATRVDILLDRETVAEGIPVTAGKITYDRNAARYARATLTVADPQRLTRRTDILSPYGYEARLLRGIMLPDGPELLPLGVFPIQTSEIDGVTIISTITTQDRSRTVSDARFEEDYQIAPGTNYADAIRDMIAAGVPGLEYLFDDTTFNTPRLTFAAQSDRWTAAQTMAKSIGREILFDGDGRCTMRPEPTFASEPVATITEGTNLTAVDMALDRDTAYNRVIATSSNASTGEVFRGVATDDDPRSPTWYEGPFGRKPRFFSSEFIASDEQAATAAASILAANIGVSQSVNFGAVPDPRLECSDVVRITRAALGIDALHIIDTLNIGLGPADPMTGTTRTQQEAT